MEINKHLQSISGLLWANDYDGVVHFDHKSYDFSEDIPHLLIDGKRVLIDKFFISKGGDFIGIWSGNDYYTLDMNYLPEDWNDTTFEDMGLFDLLQDVFYETEMSWEIGDYELNFMKGE